MARGWLSCGPTFLSNPNRAATCGPAEAFTEQFTPLHPGARRMPPFFWSCFLFPSGVHPNCHPDPQAAVFRSLRRRDLLFNFGASS